LTFKAVSSPADFERNVQIGERWFMEDRVSARVIIKGRVQGVFFRMETKRAAERLGVSGWVRNLRDGTVEALFEGKKADVDAVLRWCETGPPLSSVSHVDASWGEYTGNHGGFEVTF
jgi:acylphosphatase